MTQNDTGHAVRICPTCMADSDLLTGARFGQRLRDGEAVPGVLYSCPSCGCEWHAWPTPRYSCDLSWSDTAGIRYGCQEHGTTEVGDQLLCINHALFAELQGIRQALNDETEHADRQGDEMTETLGEIAWLMRPWWVRRWLQVKGEVLRWWQLRKQRRQLESYAGQLHSYLRDDDGVMQTEYEPTAGPTFPSGVSRSDG